MDTDIIIVSEYCQKCHIEPSFISLLEESGLIDVDEREGQSYLFASQLPELEQYARMYYDLSINMEGIDAIHHLLNRVRDLQNEVETLRKRLRVYESFD